jgi:hypothetical protein
VDDNSDDGTALKVHRFLKHRKAIVQTEKHAIETSKFRALSYHGCYHHLQSLRV